LWTTLSLAPEVMTVHFWFLGFYYYIFANKHIVEVLQQGLNFKCGSEGLLQ
jgi:hypothetical protein